MNFPPETADITRHIAQVFSPTHTVSSVLMRGHTAGFMKLHLAEDGRETVERVLLKPTLRGQGLGSQLMTAVRKLAAAYGVHMLHLVVSTVNQPAVRTYLRGGYTVDREVQALGQPWTKYLMTLDLTA